MSCEKSREPCALSCEREERLFAGISKPKIQNRDEQWRTQSIRAQSSRLTARGEAPIPKPQNTPGIVFF